MTRAVGIRLAALCLVAITLAPAPAAGQESPRKSYNDALDAMAAEDWQAAARLLRQAITLQPDERRTAMGLRSPYLPHFQLGVVLAEIGECTEALAAFAESDRQGIASKLPETVEVAGRFRDRCREQIARLASLGTQASEAVSAARELSAKVSTFARTSILAQIWREGTPSLDERQKEAVARLSRAEELLATTGGATDAIADLESASSLARSAAEALESLRADADAIHSRKLSDLQSKEERLNQIAIAIAKTREEAFDLLRKTGYLAPFPRQLESLRNALEERLRDSENDPISESPEHYEEVHGELLAAIEALGKAAEPPPPDLIEGAAAYFRGDYEQTLSVLERAAPRNRRERAHLHLLAAAARFSLYHWQGDEPASLLDQAREDARSSRRADPSLVPLARLFPPEFRLFFEASAATRTSEPAPAENSS